MGTRPLAVGGMQAALVARVTRLMEAEGISVAALARTSAVNRTRLLRALAGQRALTFDEADRICGALGLATWRVMRDIEVERDFADNGAVTELEPRETADLYMDGGPDVVDFDSVTPAAALDYGDDPEEEARGQAQKN